VPTATVTHTEPFHVSKAIATLDYVSTGRAGWQVKVSWRADEAAAFGRRAIEPIGLEDLDRPEVAARITDLFDEAADHVEVVRRLWDSWDDDAEIRFVDRDRLHYVDFEGRWFSVKGPSITPRPPQGQPIVTALAHGAVTYRLAARSADVVFVTPHDPAGARAIVQEIRAEQATAGRADEALSAYADLLVFLDESAQAAASRKARLDELAGAEYTSDAETFVGTPAQLADLLLEWRAAGLDGFRLRPAALPRDLLAITDGLVPVLQQRGAFRHEYQASTLRGLLGLPRAANRHAAA